MTVEELIAALQKSPNQKATVYFTYDYRCGGGSVNVVDFCPNEYGNRVDYVELRCEDREEYSYQNPNFTGETEEEYCKRLAAEDFGPDSWRMEYWFKEHPDDLDGFEKEKSRLIEECVETRRRKIEETATHVTLYFGERE